MKTFTLSEKELILVYLLLTKKPITDQLAESLLRKKIEKALFEFMTIEEIENIEDYYRLL